MSRLMQLSKLYGVRGSIATQTMANLSPDEVARIDEIVKTIVDDPSLAAHKYKFMKQLGNTIKGDYKSDRDVAEHEFYIAVWRATIYLLYHRDYSYYCTICGQMEYHTSNHKLKAFDRQYAVCPYCSKTLLDGRIAEFSHKDDKYWITTEDGEINESFNLRADIEKLVQTPIKTILGNKKVPNANKILNDPEQRNKWYIVWTWNYFRQILNENIIRTHNKRQIQIAGPACTMAACELINEFRRANHRYYIDNTTLYSNEIEILTNTAAMALEWTAFFVSLVDLYSHYDVDIMSTFYSIKIRGRGSIPTFVETTIATEDPVIMLSLDTPLNASSDADGSWSDIIESNIKHNKPQDDWGDNDWIDAIYYNLPDTIAKQMFDIYIQRGTVWEEFSDTYGHREAAKSHLSKFLGINPKQVDRYKLVIQDACQATGVCGPTVVNALPPLEKGEMVIISSNKGKLLAHANIQCPHIEGASWRVGTVLDVRHKTIKVNGHAQLVGICDCVYAAAAESAS